MGHFNGQGLGRSVQEFLSRRLVVNDSISVRHDLQGGSMLPRSGQRFQVKDGSDDVLQAGTATYINSESSDTVDDVTVLVRMTPGVEYIKASASIFAPLLLRRTYKVHRDRQASIFLPILPLMLCIPVACPLARFFFN